MSPAFLSDYRKISAEKRPRSITFFAPTFWPSSGEVVNLSLSIEVEDGDVYSILQRVRDEGGIGGEREGQLIFLPWPCAAVVIHDPGDIPIRAEDHLHRSGAILRWSRDG